MVLSETRRQVFLAVRGLPRRQREVLPDGCVQRPGETCQGS
ncbi:hypothetical protein AB0K12_08120 [Nonomuraea sp. NPDC049419]